MLLRTSHSTGTTGFENIFDKVMKTMLRSYFGVAMTVKNSFYLSSLPFEDTAVLSWTHIYEVMQDYGGLNYHGVMVAPFSPRTIATKERYYTPSVIDDEDFIAADTERNLLNPVCRYVFSADNEKEAIVNTIYNKKVLKSRVKRKISDVCS